MKKNLIAFCGLLLGLFILNSAQAALTPEDLIKDIFARVGKENLLLNSKTKDEVELHVDFGEMTKVILGQEGAKRSASDIKWFETTIKEIITRSVYPSAPKF